MIVPCSRIAAATLVFCIFFGSSPNAHAAYPSSCRPNAGGTVDCTAKLLTPYRYFKRTCGDWEYRSSEAAAWVDELEEWQGPRICNLVTERIGWITSPRTVWGCGITGTQPSYQNGDEVGNTSTYNFQYDDCITGQHVDRDEDEIKRVREHFCPRGYTSSTGYCYRQWLDPAKNNGPPCPPCGNPIGSGNGNKYQEETDYQGSGSFPLVFKRYYNSHLRTRDDQPGYFHYHGYYSSFGPAGYGQLALISEDHGDRFKVLTLDLIGQNWRHHYQRSIDVSDTVNGANDITTATVYRHNGRVYAFNLYGGAYVGPVDVGDRLQSLAGGGWKYTSAEADEVEIYSSSGQLLSISNRAGQTHTLFYDSSGRLSTVTDSFGHTLTFGYNIALPVPGDAYSLAKITTPANQDIVFGYDPSNRLTSVTYPGNHTRQYLYENATYNRGLTGLIDESGVRYATWGYDSYGRANLSEHAGGVDRYSLTFSGTFYELNIGIVTIVDPLGVSRTHNYANKHGVSKNTNITQPAASGTGTKSAPTTYDANGNVATKKDFNNGETRYTYDLARNLETSRTEAYGTPKARTITTQWHSTFRLPIQIDEPNRRTTFTHDANGNVLTRTVTDLSVTPNVSRTWTFTHNSLGQLLTEDGPRTDVSDITTYAYYNCSTGYQCGQVQTITNALNHVTTYTTYNVHGQSLTITDPNGVIATLTYDARQRLTSRQAGGETTSFEYWPTGLLKKITLPDSSFIQYAYDGAHRLTQVSDSQNNRIVYTLDAMGNRTKEETFDPSNYLVRLHHRAFNTFNQLWKEIGAANTAAVTTTFGYDDNGNQTSANAPLGRNTSNLYDELNRLKQITDPASGITLFGYDPNDNLTSVTDPRGKVTSYVYSGFGDLKQQTSPDTGVTDNVYDSGGNLQTSTDARSKTGTYSYDALNRAMQLSYPDQTITYTYDTGTNNKGRLMQVSDASGSTSWTYTSLGRVASRTQSMGGVNKSVGYGYNSSGQLTTLTTPSGQTITSGFANNRITSITVNSTNLLNNVLYDPFGPARQWTWGNSTLAVRSFDQDGNVDQIDSAGLRTFAQDDALRITGIMDAVNPNLTWSYGYDLLDRLISANRTAQNQTWTYDANGNRLTQGGTTSSTFTISSTSNRLSSVSGAISRTYGYDAAGSTTSYGGFTFSYNDAGRMTGVSGGATASYSLNALGQRVKKVAGGSTTCLVYDESGHLIGEYDGSGNLIQETVWMEDIPVATLRPNGGSVSIFYVHSDHLNTPRRISRPSDNAILWRWDSDPFGTDAANQDPDGDTVTFVYNLRFPGQYFDAESGLSYNYFRDLDPATGRYIQSDPIGLAGGTNTYTYVDGDPISFLDRFGLARCTYSISSHTLICDSNDYSRSALIGPEGVFSGLEECRNNPECADDKDRGPIQPGDYDMIPSRKHPGSYWLKEGFVKRQLCKLGHGRCEFFFHFGTFSRGCITVERDNLHARQQFDRIRSILRGDSRNTLNVVP